MNLDKMLNKPLLMEPLRSQVLLDSLIVPDEVLQKELTLMGEFQTNTFGPTVIEGVAVIPIMGTLVNRRSSLGFFMGTSHQDIAAMLLEAAADDSISAILLDIDSGGGEANGVFDLAETIREIDAHTPVFAIANDAAFSGAFAIASAARKVFVTRTGGVGSIGVIAHHVDISEFHKQMGIKVTAIFAGDLKGELSPIQPLSEEARARVQKEVDKTFELFVEVVAKHRGLSTQEIIATQAGLFFGQDAVDLKLADHVATFDEAMENILNTQEDSMKLFQKVNKESVSTETVSEDEIDTKAEENKKDEALEDVDTPNEDMEKAVEQDEIVHATAVEISKMALDAGCGSMIPSLLAEPHTVEEVKNKIQVSEKIINLCQKAKKPDLAEKYIEAGITVLEVQDELIDLMAKDSEKHDISSKHDAEGIDNEAIKGYASDSEVKNPLVEDAIKRNSEFQNHYNKRS